MLVNDSEEKMLEEVSIPYAFGREQGHQLDPEL